MIILTNDSLNTIVVTTQEKVIGSEPTYYIIRLTDELTNEEVLTIPKIYGTGSNGDNSLYKERYNSFDVSTGLTSSNVSGDILNLSEGQWTYEIYYEYGTIPTTDPVTITSYNLCEVGRALIK